MTSATFPMRSQTYEGHPFLNGTRWYGFVSRPGDIVITSAMKAGTTWAQVIVANLIWQDGKLPAAINTLSPWLDAQSGDHTRTLGFLDKQLHRRFIKSHLPLDGVPYFSDVHYLVLGRDPRDIFMSLWNQHQKYADDTVRFLGTFHGPNGETFPPFDNDIHAFWHDWITKSWFPWESAGYPYWSPFHHAQSWWAFRHLPNIFFVHYADLLNDTEGEIRRIAGHLNIKLDEEQLPGILERVAIDHMRDNYKSIDPAMDTLWKDGARNFINQGTNGRWRDVLSAEELGLYDEAAARALTPDCRRWLEGGGPVSAS